MAILVVCLFDRGSFFPWVVGGLRVLSANNCNGTIHFEVPTLQLRKVIDTEIREITILKILYMYSHNPIINTLFNYQ